MAKGSKGSKGAGGRGPAKEIKQGDAKVGKTSAGKPRGPIKGGGAGAALKVPGAVTGVK